MTSCKLTCLLLLSSLFLWDSADALCSLNKQTSAQCHELEDARYIDTYQLHLLRAPSSSKLLTPGNFRNLTSLRHLDLSGGKIENIASGSFAKLGSLQTLTLAENRIKHLEPGAFDGLKQLHSLKLGDNKITQLPVALMSLKQLRLLDLSKNPLNCDCASMKLRDALLARGVKISKKTLCAEPLNARDSSILKPDTTTTCAFEKEDREMQGDQPVQSSNEGSGEVVENPMKEAESAKDESEKEAENDEDDAVKEENISYDDDKEIEQPLDKESADMASPTTSTEAPLLSSTVSTSATADVEDKSSVAASTKSSEEVSSETAEDKSESITPKLEIEHHITPTSEPDPSNTILPDKILKSLDAEESIPKENEETDKEADPVKSSVTESSDNLSSSTESEKTNIIVPDEGSGDSDEGSGSEQSGMISHMPGIDFNRTRETLEEGGEEDEEEEEEVGTQISSTPSTTTTEPLTWWDFGSLLSNFNPWGSTEPTDLNASTTKSAEEALKEEQFIQVTQTPTTESAPPVEEPTVPPKVLLQDQPLPKQIFKQLGAESSGEVGEHNRVDMALDSKQSKQGTASYFVLGGILIVLVALITLGACKGNFCQKKQKRRDVERGTEMKDMQKSLLEQTTQPKVQVSNGTTLENVPLMNSSSAPPEEPKDNQKSYDITPITNGSSRPNGINSDENDPVKPPRKSLNQEIEAPLNGLNPPMDDIDGPDSPCLHNGSQDNLDSGSYDDKPPLSPGAQRVKITMQDNPDSVPKTPILITRLKGGENLVKTP